MPCQYMYKHCIYKIKKKKARKYIAREIETSFKTYEVKATHVHVYIN